MELEVQKLEDRVRFQIKGDISEPDAEELRRQFKELPLSSIKEVSFDFRHVDHIGSAGIGKLLLFYKDMAMNDGSIRVENVSEAIYDLFGVMKLDTLFPISKA